MAPPRARHRRQEKAAMPRCDRGSRSGLIVPTVFRQNPKVLSAQRAKQAPCRLPTNTDSAHLRPPSPVLSTLAQTTAPHSAHQNCRRGRCVCMRRVPSQSWHHPSSRRWRFCRRLRQEARAIAFPALVSSSRPGEAGAKHCSTMSHLDIDATTTLGV